MQKLAATVLAVLWLIAGCTTRPTSSPSTEPPSATAAAPSPPVGQTPAPGSSAATSASPKAPAQYTPPNVEALFPIQLTSLPATPLAPPAGSISSADDAGWMAARKELQSEIEASTGQPAPGLADLVLAYFRQPAVTAMSAPEHTLPGSARLDLNQFQQGTRVIVVTGHDKGTGKETWQIGLLQWREGGRVSTALIPGNYPRTYTILTDGAQPVLLAEGVPAQNAPFTFSAFSFRDGGLTAVPLAVGTPAQPGNARAAVTASGEVELQLSGPAEQLTFDPRWVCNSTSCVSLTWKKGILTWSPWAGNGGANRKMLDEQIRPTVDRFADADTVPRLQGTSPSETAQALSERVGHPVVERTYPGTDAVARIFHDETMTWLAQSVVTAKIWLQWRGGGMPNMAASVSGYQYTDCRIARDGDRYYVLLLQDADPGPYSNSLLSVYRMDSGHITQLNLPDALATSGTKYLIGDTVNEFLWAYGGKTGWWLIRLADGAFRAESIDAVAAKAMIARSK